MKKISNKIPRITTRGYYDLSSGHKIKHNPYSFYPKKSLQQLYSKKELTIMVHGLRNDGPSALKKFVIAKRRLKKLGYSYPVIGFSYDANTKGAHLKKTALKALRVGQKIAKQNGNNLSKFITDFKQKSSDTKIRLMGHSLGTEVILSTIQKLSTKSNTRNIIESVYFFGASVPSNFANSREYGKIMQEIVRKKIKNYYSPKDEVLKQSNDENWVKAPLGLYGATGKTIPKFTQKRVYPTNHRFVSYAKVLDSFP